MNWCPFPSFHFHPINIVEKDGFLPIFSKMLPAQIHHQICCHFPAPPNFWRRENATDFWLASTKFAYFPQHLLIKKSLASLFWSKFFVPFPFIIQFQQRGQNGTKWMEWRNGSIRTEMDIFHVFPFFFFNSSHQFPKVNFSFTSFPFLNTFSNSQKVTNFFIHFRHHPKFYRRFPSAHLISFRIPIFHWLIFDHFLPNKFHILCHFIKSWFVEFDKFPQNPFLSVFLSAIQKGGKEGAFQFIHLFIHIPKMCMCTQFSL